MKKPPINTGHRDSDDQGVLDLVNGQEKPEQFSLNKQTREMRRLILRRSPLAVRSTRVGFLPVSNALTDLDAAAEKILLTRTQRKHYLGRSSVRVADMFSGCGGMSLGIREACDALGFRFAPVGVFDQDENALSVYRENFGIEASTCNLETTLLADFEAPPNESEVALTESVGELDFLVAGPPCQGHSNLNNATRRSDPRNELYFRVARFARLTQPKFILIENVLTVQHDKGGVVARTRIALEKIGYRVTETVADLWKIGVPQSRRRHVLFAERKKTSPLAESRSAESILARYEVTPRTLRWAIEDLEKSESEDLLHSPSKAAPITQKRIDYLFEHDLFDLPDKMRPDCHRLKKHTYQSVYGRMRWDKQAPTITGGFDTMGRGRFVHPARRRTITPREAARIQGFPDYFDFSVAVGIRRSVIEMIGNAVPPKLAYVFALECLR